MTCSIIWDFSCTSIDSKIDIANVTLSSDNLIKFKCLDELTKRQSLHSTTPVFTVLVVISENDAKKKIQNQGED